MKKVSAEQQWKRVYIPFSKPSDYFFKMQILFTESLTWTHEAHAKRQKVLYSVQASLLCQWMFENDVTWAKLYISKY